MTTFDSDYVAFGPDEPTALNTFFTKNGGTPSFVLGVGGFGSMAGAYGETEPMAPPAGKSPAGRLRLFEPKCRCPRFVVPRDRRARHSIPKSRYPGPVARRDRRARHINIRIQWRYRHFGHAGTVGPQPACSGRTRFRRPTDPASSAHQTQLPGFMLFPTTSASSRKPLTMRPLLAFSGGMSSSMARLRPT